MDIIKKEEMLSPEEEFFAKVIRNIEDLIMTEEKNLIFLHIYLMAVTDTIELFIKRSKEIEEYPIEEEFLLHLYSKGVTDIIKLIYNYNKKNYMEFAESEEEKKLLFNMYINGIEDATYTYIKGIRIEDIIRITRDIGSLLTFAKEKFPEEIWEGIRQRVGLTNV